MAKELLYLDKVSKYYTTGQSVVMGLNSVTLSFSAGEFVAITGESGSGKSTLARVAAGILPYEGGEMVVNGRPTSHYDGRDWEHYRGHSIAYISQSYDILPGCTVLRNVVSALRLTGVEKAEAHRRAEEILRQVELWEMRGRRAAKLSSGQKQRLSIARALAKPAPILIADEPTGNLDSENSAKVIRLLAEAARERLVLMVTHDFEEAAGVATRRVTLRDGVVVADVALDAPVCPEEPAAPPLPKGEKQKGMGLYTARLQLAARPVWSVIMLVFLAFTAFAVFAFLGTFIVNLDDSSTRYYNSSAFPNGDPQRIVVVRPDGALMTEEDWDALLALDYTTSIERYGYITDISYFYRENTDLSYFFNEAMEWGQVTAVSRSTVLNGSGLFLKTVPVTAEDTGFLTAGRLPETMYEVVAAGDESMIGQRFPVYIRDNKNWHRDSYLLFTVEVVGVTDQGEHLYFSDQLGRSLTHSILTPCTDPFTITNKNGLIFLPYDYQSMLDESLQDPPEGVAYQLPLYYSSEPDMPDAEMTIYNSTVLDPNGNPVLNEDGGPYTVQVVNWQISFLTPMVGYQNCTFVRGVEATEDTTHYFAGTNAAGYHPSTHLYSITVPANAFDLLVPHTYGDQVSLFTEDYAYTDQVLSAVHDLGYLAISPYVEGSTQVNEDLAAERLQTLRICLIALVVALLLQVVVARAMFTVETEEFRLLANLGMDRHTARRSILWQILAFAAAGQLVALAALALCGGLGVERIVHVLRYLPLPYALLLSAVHFAAALLTAWWVMTAVRRQVYPFTGRRPDLNMDGLEEEV